MNSTTQHVIEFLNHPELPFGTEEDVLLLDDHAALSERVAALLNEFPAVLGADETQTLQANLAQADWPRIAQEFQQRINLASGFFDPDAEATQTANS